MSTKPERIIRSGDFAKRLTTACDANPEVPPLNYGRLSWFCNRLEEKFGESVSTETVRKWFSGEAKPRPDKLKRLATLLDVDEAWLSLGIAADLTPRERKLRNAMADGAVNVVAGFIQIDGGHPAFPEEGDERAVESQIDLYAIIKGAQYAFHVSLADQTGEVLRFAVPARYKGVIQLGVVPGPDLCVRVIEIPEERIDADGQRRGGFVEVELHAEEIAAIQIRNFQKRL